MASRLVSNSLLAVMLLFLAACTPNAAPAETPQLVKIYTTAAVRPWLSKAYTCADSLPVALYLTNDSTQADISLRLGAPEGLATPAFQIDQDDLLVVVHRESPLQNMNAESVRNLFAQPDRSVQVWVYASGEDIQQVFAREIMHGELVSSLARVALSPQQMSDTLNQEKNVVGILSRHWRVGTVRDIFTLPAVPVLALTKSEPQGLIKTLLVCLQK